jgi:aryl-alcohol dehydrogenase-like predicted oxidoreductase
MQNGLLTGAFDAARLESLAEDDWRRGSAEFKEPKFSQSMALVERLRPIASEVGCNLAELAIAWTLAVAGVTGAIVGARSPAQVDGWIGASDLDLSSDVVVEIEKAIDSTGAGSADPPAARPRG